MCLRLPLRVLNASSLAAHGVTFYPEAEAETLVLGAGATKLRRRAPSGQVSVGERGEKGASMVLAAWGRRAELRRGRNLWGRQMMLKAEKFQEKKRKERYGESVD